MVQTVTQKPADGMRLESVRIVVPLPVAIRAVNAQRAPVVRLEVEIRLTQVPARRIGQRQAGEIQS